MTKWYAFEWISHMISGGEKKEEQKMEQVLDIHQEEEEEVLFDQTVTEAIACGVLQDNQRREMMEKELAIQRKVNECIQAKRLG